MLLGAQYRETMDAIGYAVSLRNRCNRTEVSRRNRCNRARSVVQQSSMHEHHVSARVEPHLHQARG